MAAAAPASPDSARITHAEAVYHTDRQADRPLLQRLQRDRQIQESLEAAERIRSRRKPDAPRDGKAEIEAARAKNRKEKADKEATFDDKAQKEMKASFGGGRVKTEADGTVKKVNDEPVIDEEGLTPDEVKELKDKIKAGEKQVENLNKVLTYTDIVQRAQAEAEKTGRDYLVVLLETALETPTKDGKMTEDEFYELRDQSLDLLINTPAIQQLYGKQLNEVRDQNAQRTFVDVYLMSDPAVRQKLLEKMAEMKTAAGRLTAEKKDEASIKAEEDKKEADKTLDEKAAAIAKAAMTFGVKPVEVKGIDPATGNEVDLTVENFTASIKKKLEEGATFEDVVHGLRAQAFENKGLKDEDIKLITKYRNAEKEVTDLEKRLEEIQRGDRRATQLEEVRLKKLIDDKKAARDKIKNEEIRKGADDDAKNAAEQEFTGKAQDYDTIMAATNTTKDQRGAYVSSFAGDTAKAVEAAQTKKAADETIKARKDEAEKNLKSSRARRLEQETDLIDGLDNVLSESVLDVLDARIDDMNKIQDAYIKDQAEEARKKGEEEKAKNMETLGEVIRDRWVLLNDETRSKTVRYDNIRTDILYLAYNGDPSSKDGDLALQRLMLRDLGVAPQGVDTTADADWWRNVQLTQYDEKTQQRLREVLTGMQEQYRNKLFMSFVSERTMRDKLGGFLMMGSGPLTLKDHEWKLIADKYSTMVMGAVENNKAIKGRIAALEQAGVLLDVKTKFLWGLLAALGLYTAFQTGGMPYALGAGALGAFGAANADSIGAAFNQRG